jgi:hypothetical protein
MSPEDFIAASPPGVPGLDRDHPAQSRPGLVAPHSPHAELPSYDGVSIDSAILAAYMLRRTAVEWDHDPAWPRLRLVLDLALVDLQELTEEYPGSHALAHRLEWVRHLLRPAAPR